MPKVDDSQFQKPQCLLLAWQLHVASSQLRRQIYYNLDILAINSVLGLACTKLYDFDLVVSARAPEEARTKKKEKNKMAMEVRQQLLLILVPRNASILVEMEKKAHVQSNAVSFAVTIFLSGQAGGQLCLLKKLSQQKIDKFASL